MYPLQNFLIKIEHNKVLLAYTYMYACSNIIMVCIFALAYLYRAFRKTF